MKRTWVEVTCDHCACAIDHVLPGNVDQHIRDLGGIVSRKGEHFCDKACHRSFKDSNRKGQAND